MADKTQGSKDTPKTSDKKPEPSDRADGGCCSSGGCHHDAGERPDCLGSPEAPKQKPKGGGCGGGCGCK